MDIFLGCVDVFQVPWMLFSGSLDAFSGHLVFIRVARSIRVSWILFWVPWILLGYLDLFSGYLNVFQVSWISFRFPGYFPGYLDFIGILLQGTWDN